MTNNIIIGLLETKGVHREIPSKDTPLETKGSKESGASETNSKPSLKEKIKAKLHKH